MNKYFWGVVIAVFGTLFVSVPIGLKYSQAAFLFGAIALVSAPIVIHKIEDTSWSIGMLVGLSFFASFPLKKLYDIEGFFAEMATTVVCAGVLWVVGFGWKRSWR